MENSKVELSDGTTLMDITDTTATESDVVSGQVFYKANGVRSVGSANYIPVISNPTADNILIDDGNGKAADSGIFIHDVIKNTDVATERTYGVVKLNPNESVDLNANGQLTVGGRLGQFSGGGVFYPTTIEPTGVGASSFLMTDGAKGLFIGGRQFGILAGANLTCKSASAGATTYRLTNSQINRFACFAGKGGFLAIDQTDASTNGAKPITDISFANGDPISAYFGPTENSNDIIITVATTVNPNASTTKLRIYGKSTSNDVIQVGQGSGASGGKAISLGQSCYAGGNQTMALGNSSIVTANNSVALGHTHLVNKQFCLSAGQGHDFTNASNGTTAVGIASELSNDTAFAVGNGTFDGMGNSVRSNALEVKSDGSLKSPLFEALSDGIVIPSSTSGSSKKFKITVDDTGSITATEVV